MPFQKIDNAAYAADQSLDTGMLHDLETSLLHVATNRLRGASCAFDYQSPPIILHTDGWGFLTFLYPISPLCSQLTVRIRHNVPSKATDAGAEVFWCAGALSMDSFNDGANELPFLSVVALTESATSDLETSKIDLSLGSGSARIKGYAIVFVGFSSAIGDYSSLENSFTTHPTLDYAGRVRKSPTEVVFNAHDSDHISSDNVPQEALRIVTISDDEEVAVAPQLLQDDSVSENESGVDGSGNPTYTPTTRDKFYIRIDEPEDYEAHQAPYTDTGVTYRFNSKYKYQWAEVGYISLYGVEIHESASDTPSSLGSMLDNEQPTRDLAGVGLYSLGEGLMRTQGRIVHLGPHIEPTNLDNASRVRNRINTIRDNASLDSYVSTCQALVGRMPTLKIDGGSALTWTLYEVTALVSLIEVVRETPHEWEMRFRLTCHRGDGGNSTSSPVLKLPMLALPYIYGGPQINDQAFQSLAVLSGSRGDPTLTSGALKGLIPENAWSQGGYQPIKLSIKDNNDYNLRYLKLEVYHPSTDYQAGLARGGARYLHVHSWTIVQSPILSFDSSSVGV